MTDARQTLEDIRANIARACDRAGRDPAGVTLIGVTKRQPLERVVPVLQAGLADIGENYVQEGITRLADLRAALPALAVRPHFIGALQSNKARLAVGHFEVIHSVDRPSLAKAVAAAARAAGKVQTVLLQVNLGEEATKAGCEPDELRALARHCATMAGLRVAGLMALPPYCDNPEDARPYFRELRRLRDAMRAELGEGVHHLSMGMTHDYEVAVEEGATMVRIGTGLFGAR